MRRGCDSCSCRSESPYGPRGMGSALDRRVGTGRSPSQSLRAQRSDSRGGTGRGEHRSLLPKGICLSRLPWASHGARPQPTLSLSLSLSLMPEHARAQGGAVCGTALHFAGLHESCCVWPYCISWRDSHGAGCLGVTPSSKSLRAGHVPSLTRPNRPSVSSIPRPAAQRSK